MAESTFLPYQDSNNDGIHNDCPVDIVLEPNVCPDCAPNPKALVPRWKKRGITEPFLNEKSCKFQVTKVTPHTEIVDRSTIIAYENNGNEVPADIQDTQLNKKFEEYLDEVIDTFLTEYDKLVTTPNIETLREAIEFTAFDLDPRPHSKLKLLYSVPFTVLNNLEEDEEEEETEEPKLDDITVKYNATDMAIKLIRVRKGLGLYNRYLKVYRAIEGGNIWYEETGSLFNLEVYGDIGFFPDCEMADLLTQLDSFLNQKGYNIPGAGVAGYFAKKVTKLQFTFTGKRKLKKLRAWTAGCPHTPKTWGPKKLKSLNNRSAWKNPTAVGYLIKLFEMERDLTARRPKPWLEFLEEHTYPKIYSTDSTIDEDEDPESPSKKSKKKKKTALSCVGDSLMGEAKQLGQDIMDEVFSIGDAIAYQFHKNLCRENLSEVIDDWADTIGENGNFGDVASMGAEQAYKELIASDDVFVRMCANFIGSSIGVGGSPVGSLDDVWYHGFDEIKICGLFDLILDMLKCLLNGLTLEEALAGMIRSALNAMGVENFGSLFVGLPPEKQAELDALVQRKLNSGDIFAAGSDLQKLSDAIEGGGTGSRNDPQNRGQVTYTKPWEKEEVVQAERDNKRTGGGDAEVPGVPKNENAITGQRNERTLAQQFGSISENANNELSDDNIMEAYIKALIEVYSQDLMSLLDELNKFPGAQFVAKIFATLDCPMPPIFNPGLFDWLKDLTLPFCRNMSDLTFPRFENPFAEIANLKDILYLLWLIALWVIQQLIMKIIMMILIRLCELFSDIICKALATVGNLAASLPDIISGKETFASVIRESICGPDASDEQVNDTIVDMMESLGATSISPDGAAAMGNRERLIQFAEDISSATTRSELMESFLGEPSDQVLSVVDQLIDFEYPELREGLPNKRAIGSLLGNCGNLMPAEFKEDMRNFLEGLPPDDEMPANPSLCATPGQIEQFKELRCSLLEGRATKEQCDTMFDALRGNDPDNPGFLSDLEDLTQMMQDGIPKYMEDMMPPLVSDPGCDNGLLPFEPAEITELSQNGFGGSWEQLKIAYSTDMLGNGNFRNSDSNWGLLNMVMSDTMGNPLSVHHRKVFAQENYVDYYIDTTELPAAANQEPLSILGIQIFGSPFEKAPSVEPIQQQRGAYPLYVAEHLYIQLKDIRNQVSGEGATDPKHNLATFRSTNASMRDRQIIKSFKDLGFDGPYGPDPDPLSMPDLGYNVTSLIKMDPSKSGGGYVRFIRNARKADPDMTLSFFDNGYGLRRDLAGARASLAPELNPETQARPSTGKGDTIQGYTLGSEINIFLSDIVNPRPVPPPPPGPGEGAVTTDDPPDPVPFNLPTDNIRLQIFDLVNLNSDAAGAAAAGVKEREADREGDDLSEVSQLKSLKYEFMGVDDNLKDVDASQFPQFYDSFVSEQSQIPQARLLSDLTGIPVGECVTLHNDVMNSVYRALLDTILDTDASLVESLDEREVGEGHPGYNVPPSFIYGAELDAITPDMFDYVVPQSIRDDSEYRDSGDENLMKDLEIKDYDKDGIEFDWRSIRNGDLVLGVSRDAFNNETAGTPELTRVVYLDPKKFGGRYLRPKVTVKPQVNMGWMGFADALFPQISPCKPQRTDMVDFGDISDTINDELMFISHDQRLKESKECAIEKPFNRILERSGKAGVHGVIRAACRIFGSTYMILGMPVFSKIAPRFPDNFSNVYAAYIVEIMEQACKDAQNGAWSWFNPFKDNDFWYSFLEQAVQTYGRLVDDGKIADPPKYILDILWDLTPRGSLGDMSSGLGNGLSLNSAQVYYDYPWRSDWWESVFSGEISIFKSLSKYRKETALATVAKYEEACKIILQEFIRNELNWTGENFMKNLKTTGLTPKHYDLDYFLLEQMTAGGIPPRDVPGREYTGPSGSNRPEADVPGLDLEWPVKEVLLGGSKVQGQDYYTNGGELMYLDGGKEYVGPYHIALDSEGEEVFKAGDASAPVDSANHDPDQPTLKVLANSTVVPIGSVETWTGTRPLSFTADQPFAIQMYTSINGTKYAPSDAISLIRSHPDQSQLISEVYPGTMKNLKDEEGNIIGIEGELGVRHGITFWIGSESTAAEIVSVEIDALDYTLDRATKFEGNSPILWCLLRNLKNHKKFKLISHYVFPLNKVAATLAIYCTENFINSIGQISVGNNSTYGFFSFNKYSPWGYADKEYTGKPGSRASIDTELVESGSRKYLKVDFTQEGNPGWASFADRNPGFWAGLWVKHWDKWDRILLRKSTSKLKILFNAYYNNRNFGGPKMKAPKGSQIWAQGLSEALKPAPGASYKPDWAKFVGNAWNAEGGLCDKFDSD